MNIRPTLTRTVRHRTTTAALVALIVAGCGSSSTIQTDTTSRDVITAFKRAGLEAENPTPMTAQDFAIAPRVTSDATHFMIPSLCEDCGGRVLVFDDLAKLREDKDAYQRLGDPGTMLGSWVFANEKAGVLVQINGDLARATADRYRRVVANLGS